MSLSLQKTQIARDFHL